MRRVALALMTLTTLTVLGLPPPALGVERLVIGGSVAAQAGVGVKAVVVRSWSRCHSFSVLWEEINAHWPDYGTTPVTIDHKSEGLCLGPVTYDALVASEADVLIISDPAGGNKQYTADEVAAVRRYVRDGHGVIGSFLFLFGPVDDRALLALFGLSTTADYHPSNVEPVYHIVARANPLFANIEEPYASTGWPETQTPADGSWGPEELAGARIVARTVETEAVVTVFHDRTYGAVYVSSMPEYQGGVIDAQFWYNAIVYAAT